MAQQTHFEEEEKNYKAQHVVEAALFMANKSMPFAELAQLANASEDEISTVLEALKKQLEESDRAVELVVNQEAKTVVMQVKAKWLASVARLTDKIELHKKSMKILALIAKKGELLQSDLRKYFKGDIYEYVGELREKGYVERHKVGHSWKIKPTKKFHEEFQITIAEETPIKQIELAEAKENTEQKSEDKPTTQEGEANG